MNYNFTDGKTKDQIDQILTEDGIQMYLISDHSEQRILVLVTIWWGKKLGIDWK
jgi:hypothetical protein